MSASTLSRTLRSYTTALRHPCCTGHSRHPSRAFRSSASRMDQIHDANAETLANAVAKENSAEKVILVDFYADWCSPCHMLSPILEKLTAGSPSQTRTGSGRQLDLITVDTEKEEVLSQQYKVRSLPTVLAFKDGEVVDQFIGALNEAGVRKFVEQL